MTRLFSTFGTLKEIAKETPEIHHYTSSAGLQGIIGTNTFWATHYIGLNDSSEASMLRVIFRERLAEWLSRNLKKRTKRFETLPYRLRDNRILDTKKSMSVFSAY